MNDKPNQKMTLHVLQVFIASFNKGLDETLCAAEIKTAVCRAARKISPRDKQSARDVTDRALKQLVRCGVLFRTVLDGPRDKIGHRVNGEIRHLYTLSKDSWNYLKKNTIVSEKPANLKFDFIRTMLEHFGVIPSVQKVLPVVLENTIAEIKREDTTAQPAVLRAIPASAAVTQPAEDKTQKLIEQVRGEKEVGGYCSPAVLLGALRALGAVGENNRVSSAAMHFESHAMRPAREYLEQLNLVGKYVPEDGTGRYRGLYLTDLGYLVANCGDFVDNRSDAVKYIRPPVTKDTMLKNSKKTTSAPTIVSVRLVNGELGQIDLAELGRSVFVAQGGQIIEPEKAPTARELRQQVDSTIAAIVGPATTAIITSITTMPDATLTNLCYALSQAHYVTNALKHYIVEQRAAGKPLDFKYLQDYAAAVELSMEELAKGTKRDLPLLTEERDQRKKKSPKLPNTYSISTTHFTPDAVTS